MKLNCWLILGTMLSTSLLAQQATNSPSAAPATTPAVPAIETPAAAPAAITNAPAAAPATTNAPAATAPKKKAPAKKKTPPKSIAKAAPKKAPVYETSTTPLVPGLATVVASNVNVRAQATLKSEVVTKVTKGQELTVLEEIVHNNSGPTEPSAWAKIQLPATAHVWVNSAFLNPDKTVKPNRLKLRGGPGENYSMLGIIDKGQAVKEITTKGEWTQIEAPANAYAFVAAQYLKQEAPGAIASSTTSNATTVAEAPTTTTTVAENPTVAAPPTDTTTPSATITNAPTLAETGTNAPTVAANTETNVPEAKVEEPLPPRIISHEGVVRGMTSIQAPSHFELISADNGRRINYLYTTSTNLDLRRYKGLHVVVTGEEGLDERWGNTPVLSIQRIQVVDDKFAQ